MDTTERKEVYALPSLHIHRCVCSLKRWAQISRYFHHTKSLEKNMRSFVLLALLGLVSGCASMRPTYQTESAYIIYDVQPVSVDRNQLLNAVLESVQKNSSKVRVNRDIPPAELPEKPARFELKEPFANSNFGALMAAQGQNYRVPVCKNPLITISSDNNSMAQYGEKTTFFLCVLPYKDGYHIDIYATFTRASGGFSPQALGSAMARSVVGDSSQFIPRTMNDVRAAAEALGGKVTVVDSYIPEAFKGYFVNQSASAAK